MIDGWKKRFCLISAVLKTAPSESIATKVLNRGWNWIVVVLEVIGRGFWQWRRGEARVMWGTRL